MTSQNPSLYEMLTLNCNMIMITCIVVMKLIS